MPSTFDPRRPRAIALALLAAGAVPGNSPAESPDPWQAASTFLVKDAHNMFQQGEGGGELEREFGTAITLLNLQPRTQGNLRRALELFESVAAKSEPGGTLQNLALFFRARVLEFHLEPPDPAAASAQYIELLERRTKNPVIELGAARLVMMAGLGPAPRERILEELRSLENLAGLLETPAGKREFHATMAYAILDNDGDASRAVDHFLAAEAAGFTRKVSALRIWLIGGDVAARAGRPRDAAFFYNRMLENFPRDPRAYTVRQRLKSLQAADG